MRVTWRTSSVHSDSRQALGRLLGVHVKNSAWCWKLSNQGTKMLFSVKIAVNFGHGVGATTALVLATGKTSQFPSALHISAGVRPREVQSLWSRDHLRRDVHFAGRLY